MISERHRISESFLMGRGPEALENETLRIASLVTGVFASAHVRSRQVLEEGYSAQNVAFGMGGGLLQKVRKFYPRNVQRPTESD